MGIRKMPWQCTGNALLAAVLLFAAAHPVPAQQIVAGAGLNGGRVPRALAPLCGAARNLNGVGLTGQIGLVTNSIRVIGNVDYLARIGIHDAASCIPRFGVSVDSVFDPADESATTFSADVWIPVGNGLELGAGTGIVHNHSSWFIGPLFGGQYRRWRLEGIARRHKTSFDEVTNDYGSGTTREISRNSRSESSWAFVARVLLRIE
jgi:hypothetical protein